MGCVWVYMQKVELRHWLEYGNDKNRNKLVEWKARVDSMGIKGADLEDKFLF